jgi:hypothetical protein
VVKISALVILFILALAWICSLGPQTATIEDDGYLEGWQRAMKQR